jgi:phosphopantothenoylcysteine decarboxylase/phosphopantothenate--cysteine ligase
MAKSTGQLKGIKVLLGVTGGVAAYKAVALASKLTGGGAVVKTVMTANACELVRPKSFEAVTGSQVFTNLWSCPEEYKIGHVSLAEWADIIVVAPATANILAKIANGICDDLLSTLLCAGFRKPVLIAPAMNNNMWANPAVQKNIKTVCEMGFEMIGPVEGRLACGSEAIGRMAEPEEILKMAEKIAAGLRKGK